MGPNSREDLIAEDQDPLLGVRPEITQMVGVGTVYSAIANAQTLIKLTL
jgi:hypothetical protein